MNSEKLKGVVISVALLFFVFVINSIFYLSTSNSIFLFFASFNEEICRFASLFIIPPWLYTFLLAIFEFLNYIFFDDNKITLSFVIIRTIIIFVHFSFYKIQYSAYIKYRKTNDKSHLVKGIGLAIAAHLLWNFLFCGIISITVETIF